MKKADEKIKFLKHDLSKLEVENEKLKEKLETKVREIQKEEDEKDYTRNLHIAPIFGDRTKIKTNNHFTVRQKKRFLRGKTAGGF